METPFVSSHAFYCGLEYVAETASIARKADSRSVAALSRPVRGASGLCALQ